MSSTLHELAAERDAARQAIESLKLIPVMFETGARPHPPRALYRSYLDQSDVFIAIYSQSYGWVAPDMDISGLEDEFILSEGKPRLIYMKKGGQPEPRLVELFDRVRDAGISYKHFEDPTQLADIIRDDLVLLLTERFHETDEKPEESDGPAPAKLPAQLTPFIGRERELRSLTAHLDLEDVRLTTLTGPGGIGKTRLAIEACVRVQSGWEAVYFVPLAPIRDPDLVADEVAKVLGLPRTGLMNPLDDVSDFLRDRRAILVLDNFEQVLPAAPDVSELLGRCARLKVIVTSRAPLRLRGEHEFYVPPLAIPRADRQEEVMDFDSVKLFVRRAQDVVPNFELDDRNAPAIAEICDRLDGLPLAIELAAARMRLLTPRVLLERLEERFSLLSGGARDMPERHQRLRDTIAWSYELLDTHSKCLFTRIGAFRGGFTLDAVEDVCGYDDLDVLSALSALIDQSLVRSGIVNEGEPRFMMLETIREFAAELLENDEDLEKMVYRHGRYYADLFCEIGRSTRTERQKTSLQELEIEIDNVRAAFTRMIDRKEIEILASAAFEGWWFWWSRGFIQEGRRLTDRILEYRDLLSEHGLARALTAMAAMAFWQNDMAAAVPAFFEAREIFEKVEDKRGHALCDLGLGMVQAFLGDPDAGFAQVVTAHETFSEVGDMAGATISLNGLNWGKSILRDFRGSEETAQRALDLSIEIGSQIDIGIAEGNLGVYRWSQGDEEDGLRLLADALRHLGEVRHTGAIAAVLDYIAEIVLQRNRTYEGVVLLGATDAMRRRTGTANPPAAQERTAKLATAARAQLGKEEFERAERYGRGMDLHEAVNAGLAEVSPLTV